jgi:hypothetical protein
VRSSLKSIHVDLGYDTSFFNSDLIKRICRGAQKVHAIPPRPKRKELTLNTLETIIQLCDSKSYDDTSIRTALCVAFAGFLRSQDFTYSNWTPADQASKPTRSSVKFGKDTATLELPISKTDQLRKGTSITLAANNLPSCPVANLRYLFTQFPASPHAPLFGRGSPTSAFTGIYFTRSYFTNAFRDLLLRANIDPTGYTGHSLRRGAAQSAADAGLPMEDIQTLGRWKSDAVLRYVRPETAEHLRRTRKSRAPRYRKQ